MNVELFDCMTNRHESFNILYFILFYHHLRLDMNHKHLLAVISVFVIFSCVGLFQLVIVNVD